MDLLGLICHLNTSKVIGGQFQSELKILSPWLFGWNQFIICEIVKADGKYDPEVKQTYVTNTLIVFRIVCFHRVLD